MQLSVIIPVYNAETYLEECVVSIISSGIKDMEIILIDDGSCDHSFQICRRLESSDTRVRAYHKENGGSSSARNFGLDLAAGDYINFIDSDDTVIPAEYASAFRETVRNEYDLSCFRICNCREEDPEADDKYGVWTMFVKAPVRMHSVCDKFFRRDILHELRFDEDLTVSEDMLFCAKAYLNSKRAAFIERDVYLYRESGESVTHSTDSFKKSRDDRIAAERLLSYSAEKGSFSGIETLVAYRHQIAALRYLTEPELFSVQNYRMTVTDKHAYQYIKDRKHRILCWCANHSLNVVPVVYIALKKLRERFNNHLQ